MKWRFFRRLYQKGITKFWFVDTTYLKLYHFYFLHGVSISFFVTRGVFLFEPCAYCWQSRKCFARELCANASTALITKAQAIVTAKWYAATRADIQGQTFQYEMRLSDGSRQPATVAWQKLTWESMMSSVLYVKRSSVFCSLAAEAVTILQWR